MKDYRLIFGIILYFQHYFVTLCGFSSDILYYLLICKYIFVAFLGIDIDCLGGRVYWSDIAGQSIKSSKYDGTDVQDFLTSGMKPTLM